MATTETDIHRDLIEQCRQGKRQCFRELYRLYSTAMFNVAMRMLGDRQHAEDVLQESFADAFARIGEFRFEASFGSWLKQIVINKCISDLRKKKVELEFIGDLERMDCVEETQAGQEFENALKVKLVKEAMQSLPDGSRSVFSLYLFEGYDHSEIAEILHISESTSKSQYMRARLKIKELLIQYSHEGR